MKKLLQKAVIFPLIVVIAVALVIFKVKSRPPIEHEVLQYPVKAVDVIKLQKRPFRSRAIAYGNVEPAVLLKARAEVSGKLSYIHPLLKKGASLSKGTVVLRIEPTTFEFSLDQSREELISSRHSLEQLEIEEKSTLRSLQIAIKNLKIGEQELQRLQKLWKQRLVSRSAVDTEQQKVLQLRQQLEDLEGKAATYASRKSVTEAQIKQSQSHLAQNEDTLERTEIRLPFDARIGQVSVQKGEYVSTGTILFEALGVQAVEINAQLPVSQFYSLVKGFEKHSLNLENVEDLQYEFLNMKFQAVVRLVGYDGELAQWPGELLRIGEAIDPQRDTIGLVVAVNNPYDNVIPGVRPPLLKGMFASVEFFTPKRDVLVIPRKAIHQGRIYIANENNKLEIHKVVIDKKQGNLVVLSIPESDEFKPGTRLIISDVIPVLDGMPLDPVEASDYEQQLNKEALGDDVLRRSGAVQ